MIKFIFSLVATTLLILTTAMGGTINVTNNSSNTDNHKLWKEKIIPMFEKENPGIKVKMTIYDHEAYKTAIRNFLSIKGFLRMLVMCGISMVFMQSCPQHAQQLLWIINSGEFQLPTTSGESIIVRIFLQSTDLESRELWQI